MPAVLLERIRLASRRRLDWTLPPFIHAYRCERRGLRYYARRIRLACNSREWILDNTIDALKRSTEVGLGGLKTA
jgi:hypothetical protein